MKFIVAFILTILLSYAASLFFPWWIIAVASFIVAALIHQAAFKAFLSGFLALLILWGAMAFFIDLKNNHLLSTKVAKLLQLGNPSLLIVITAVVGALVAGMAAMTGSYLRRGYKHKVKTNPA